MSRDPLPDLACEEIRGYYEGAARGELVVPRCSACGRYVWYPAPRCPDCGGQELPWTAVSGRGELFSFARVERALFAPFRDRVPYAPGLVALEEDPRVRLVTAMVDCDLSDLRPDLPVEVVFRELTFDGEHAVVAPYFRPRSEGKTPS